MRLLISYTLTLAALLSIGARARAQSVGLFGAAPPRRSSVKVPSRIRSLLPVGARVRIWGPTKLTRQGEEFLLYDVGADQFYAGHSEAAFVRGRTLLQKVDVTEDCYISRFTIFNVVPNIQSVAMVFRCYGDGAEAQFVFLGAPQGDKYKKILDLKTMEGRIRIHEGTPVLLETWSARLDHDPPDPEQSCIWCEHHYEIRTYEMRAGVFAPHEKSEITDDTFDPGDFLDQPLEVVPPGQN